MGDDHPLDANDDVNDEWMGWDEQQALRQSTPHSARQAELNTRDPSWTQAPLLDSEVHRHDLSMWT